MILVTGAAGFIGSNLVKGLNLKGYTDLILVDDLTGENEKNLANLNFSAVVGIDEYLKKHRNWSKLDAVFHLGACSDTTETRVDYILPRNTGYTMTLFRHCQRQRIPFIYASSAAVYGNGEKGFKEDPTCEAPLNLYGESKLRFDQALRRELEQEKGLSAPTIGLRYFNVYGANELHKGRMASVALHLMKQGESESTLKIFEGSENFRRDFIHVDDTVAVKLFFLENPKTGIYNVGTGQAASFLQLAKAVNKHFPEANIDFIPFPEDLKGKYQKFTQANIEKLREAGFEKEFVSLEEGVNRYWKAFSENGGYLL
jgi:ADP-L-glycero-D-manno-heptose 6-epimerase